MPPERRRREELKCTGAEQQKKCGAILFLAPFLVTFFELKKVTIKKQKQEK